MVKVTMVFFGIPREPDLGAAYSALKWGLKCADSQAIREAQGLLGFSEVQSIREG